jgi:hypothetical protein
VIDDVRQPGMIADVSLRMLYLTLPAGTRADPADCRVPERGHGA